MFVLGTAGHIDHGKSSLIRAMTGIDPDRLPEEQSRGMTIDLGFAWLKLPDGGEIGLIDVPGHERFVRNMVAGAGGVNAAMLVIAADDGWMPQTQEHLDILKLLNIRHGLVALTKTDLVEPDWLELIRSDIETKLTGTFLEKAPIIPVSSTTGEGVDRVVESISQIASSLQEVEDISKSRLFVDRVFLLTGIGVVVTGTSRGGGFSADSDVYHFPSGDKIKIRTLQSHERKVDRVGAGYRVAINLSGVDRRGVNRGDVITGFPWKGQPSFLAVKVKNLPNSTVSMKEGRKVLLILGTTETEAIIRPFASDGIKPGQEGFAIIKTVAPVAAFIHDNFILRLPTPQVTIGGGTILDFLDHYPRRKDLKAISPNLEARQEKNPSRIIVAELEKRLFRKAENILLYSSFSSENIQTAVASLLDENIIIAHDGYLALSVCISVVLKKLHKELDKTHKHKSYLPGLTADVLGKRLRLPIDDQFVLLLKYLESADHIGRTRQFYHQPGFTPQLDEKMKAQAEGIRVEMKKAGHNYPTLDQIEAQFGDSGKTINFLRDDGKIRKVGDQFLMTVEIWKEIIAFVTEKLETDGKLTVAEYRDRFQNSRKFVLPVLEQLDQLGLTRREGDYRVKGARFDERHSI
ncbi:MAG: selenocysteine-specific translation elongation factor [FCB group bacterium]|nr:selenocysteine-specific translation elongation factor [FCB group bacterium]